MGLIFLITVILGKFIRRCNEICTLWSFSFHMIYVFDTPFKTGHYFERQKFPSAVFRRNCFLLLDLVWYRQSDWLKLQLMKHRPFFCVNGTIEPHVFVAKNISNNMMYCVLLWVNIVIHIPAEFSEDTFLSCIMIMVTFESPF